MPNNRTLYFLHDVHEVQTRSYCLLSEALNPRQISDLNGLLGPKFKLMIEEDARTQVQEDRVVVTWHHPLMEDLREKGREIADIQVRIEDGLRDDIPRVCGWTPPEIVFLLNRREAQGHGFHIPRHLDL